MKIGNQNNVNACKVDTFQLTVTPAGPLTGNLIMTLRLNLNEEVFAPFISTLLGVATMNFGNNLSASTHTFFFYVKINCDAIPFSTSFVTYTDSAKLFLNSISYNLSDWQIKNPNQHEFIYQWGFPSLDITTNQNISVDFIDVYNSDSIPIVRTIQYINNGVAPGDFFGKIKYADSINCSEVIVDSIRIFVDTVEILPMTSVNSNSFTTAEILCSIPLGSMLIIKEVLAFPNFMDTCINTCTASNLRFNNLLSWGCDSAGSSNLCRTVTGQSNVQTGTKNPRLTINRIEPLPSGNAPDFNYWDAGTSGSPVHWQFLITNTGDDVAKDVLIRLWNQFPKSLYYIEEDSIHVTFAAPHENIDTISTFASILLASRFSTDSPACLINFTKPIIDKSYTLNYLFPSESVLIEFTTRFCCPESDDGTNNHINRFNDPKTFNTWQFEIKGRDECGITTNCPNATTTDTSISRYEVTTYISPNSGYTGIHLYLDQEHIPPASNGLDAAPGGCSGTKVFELRNNLFNLQTSTLDFLQSDANFFSNTYHNDPDSMIVSAIVRFQFELEQGLYLDTIDSSFVFQSGTSVLWPVSTVQKVVHTNCTGKDVYQADFNITDLPTGSSLTSFYSFMNSSTLRFKLYGCCCYAANTNPEYTVKTLLSGLNSSCFVPMTEKSGGTFIHCQGCQVPGIIVNETDSILYRTTVGWEDMDNDGILNIPAVRASSNIKINQSIVGDTLESLISASISSIGSGGCSIDSLQAMNINLNKLYLEAKIDNSDTTRFNLKFNQYPINNLPL